ncbi:MAG TPA: hypothetical protein P5328_02705 [Candidatus Paceibacterota bacterium]|nr:hypothetical protein [Candidatus Paceibacterota bacterium]HRZ34351.1 hypothetical protein [Candidatus Paceibacterota bacterium]
MLGQYKKIIIIIVVVAVIFGLYTFLKSSIVSTESSLVISGQQSVNILGQDIIRVLNRIKSINLDRGVFEDVVYKRLVDYSREMASQPVGRDNIFLPYSTTGSPAENSEEESNN